VNRGQPFPLHNSTQGESSGDVVVRLRGLVLDRTSGFLREKSYDSFRWHSGAQVERTGNESEIRRRRHNDNGYR
jgi:hypothetical protein